MEVRQEDVSNKRERKKEEMERRRRQLSNEIKTHAEKCVRTEESTQIQYTHM